MGGVGPIFGQLGFFYKFAGSAVEDKRPLERYRDETKRLLGVLETRHSGRQWIMGDDYTIADIALFPWVRTVRDFYQAGEIVGLAAMPNVPAWLDRCLARPASQTGLNIPRARKAVAIRRTAATARPPGAIVPACRSWAR